MKIQKKKNLTSLNTFKVNATADFFAEITSEQELEEALDYASARSIPFEIIGGGSNILFAQDFKGMVIRVRNKGILWEKAKDSDRQKVTASAGEDWHNFVTRCLEKNLYGLENLALIPGTVGGAPIQNIGAYGVEVEEFISGVKVFDVIEKKWISIERKNCGFSYRNSIFKTSDRFIIYNVIFDLVRNWEPRLNHKELSAKFVSKKTTAAVVYDEICKLRNKKLPDPSVIGNAGSFFKNPIIPISKFEKLKTKFPDIPFYETENSSFLKIPAAWLLDYLGWKGKTLGGASVSPKHALIITNSGNASGENILDLAKKMSSSVFDNFGIMLVPEVRIIGVNSNLLQPT